LPPGHTIDSSRDNLRRFDARLFLNVQQVRAQGLGYLAVPKQHTDAQDGAARHNRAGLVSSFSSPQLGVCPFLGRAFDHKVQYRLEKGDCG